jgi:hypothetical protein
LAKFQLLAKVAPRGALEKRDCRPGSHQADECATIHQVSMTKFILIAH